MFLFLGFYKLYVELNIYKYVCVRTYIYMKYKTFTISIHYIPKVLEVFPKLVGFFL